jgi:hypothetical protein
MEKDIEVDDTFFKKPSEDGVIIRNAKIQGGIMDKNQQREKTFADSMEEFLGGEPVNNTGKLIDSNLNETNDEEMIHIYHHNISGKEELYKLIDICLIVGAVLLTSVFFISSGSWWSLTGLLPLLCIKA